MNRALHPCRRKAAGFTLVEIMIVVAIIALLAAIAVPNFQRARKRSQASRILSDLRIVDYALDRWAIENNKLGTATATFEDLRPYLKQGSQMYITGSDVLGGIIGPGIVVDVGPRLPDSTWEALSDVAPNDFWSPYR
jgi:prepilin-type N-terminal cleavage/methylation domain-containing protein